MVDSGFVASMGRPGGSQPPGSGHSRRRARSGLREDSKLGFSGNADQVVAKALDSTGGFHLVLAGAKFFLEHGIEPNLVVDRAPDAVASSWSPGR
jgi:hypothetical protein